MRSRTDFYIKNRNGDVDSTCRTCTSERSRERNSQAHIQQRTRERKFRSLYGITVAEHEKMKEAQGNLCAICKNPAGAKGLHVDHDHRTGVVRELLCLACNALLGQSREDPSILLAAVAYLERHKRVVPTIA